MLSKDKLQLDVDFSFWIGEKTDLPSEAGWNKPMKSLFKYCAIESIGCIILLER